MTFHFGHIVKFMPLALAIASSCLADLPTIRFSCSDNNPDKINQAAHFIYQSVFNDLGYQFEMVVLPDLRAINAITEENVDGHCGFTQEQLKNFTSNSKITLLKVPVAITHVVAISTSKHFTDFANLFQLDLRVGYVIGEYAAVYLEHMGYEHAIPLTSVANASKMLKAGRLDVLVSTDFRHHYYTKNGSIDFSGHYTELSSAASFPAMHIKHRALFKDIERLIPEKLAPYGGPIQKDTLHLWPNLGISKD